MWLVYVIYAQATGCTPGGKQVSWGVSVLDMGFAGSVAVFLSG